MYSCVRFRGRTRRVGLGLLYGSPIFIGAERFAVVIPYKPT